MRYRIFFFIVFTGLVFAGLGCSGSNKATSAPYSGAILDQYTSDPSRLLVIETRQGTIKIQLFDKIAPNHVAQITKLAQDGEYNGTTFHRVKDDLLQGGDPNSKGDDRSLDGIGGMGNALQAEFSSIGHKRGVCSMARGSDINSAQSQFFICVADRPNFDHRYSVWGQVVEGYSTIDSIASLSESKKYPRGPDGSVNPGKDALITKAWVQK